MDDEELKENGFDGPEVDDVDLDAPIEGGFGEEEETDADSKFT